MEGLKRKRRCQFECKEHLFELKNVRNNSSKYDHKILFCPKYQREPFPPEHTFPEFNLDNKYYTSAFVLGVDRRFLNKNDQQELMDHQKQIRQSLQKHNQLVFPRPTSKHVVCSVCKQPYKNYYFHIASQDHRERIIISPYNDHIKKLCNRYRQLWEGAEERADEEAERIEEEEEKLKNQLAQKHQEHSESSESLLDVDRGEIDQDEAQSVKIKKQDKISRKVSRSVYNNEDTIPITTKPLKRAHSDLKKANSSEHIRRRTSAGTYVAVNTVHQQREREERRYERERDKIRSQGVDQIKQYNKVQQKQGDYFIVMKASFSMKKPVAGEFVWKKSRINYIMQKEIEGFERSRERDQDNKYKYEQEHKKYEALQEDKKTQRNQIVISPSQSPPRREPLRYSYPPYPPPDYKNMPEYKHSPERYKNPYYYPPYYHPMQYPPYPRHDKPYEYERDKSKGDKGYEYSMMPYPWPYQPYYMPPMPPVSHHSDNQPNKQKQNNSFGNNTSININFPMCIYSPHHPPYSMPPPPHSRYAMPPVMPQSYMSYQYPPYAHRQTQYQNNQRKQPIDLDSGIAQPANTQRNSSSKIPSQIYPYPYPPRITHSPSPK